MKRKLLLLEVLATVLAFGLVLAGCDDGGSNNGSSSSAKSIKTTGVGDYIGKYYEMGLATSINKLLDEDLVAYTE
jgi:hypothetical protein